MTEFSWSEFIGVIAVWLQGTVTKVFTALLILLIASVAISIIKKTLKRIFDKSHADEVAAGFVISVVKYVCWAVAIIAALGNIINLNSVVAALGAAGLTASFALQGSLSNFISGVQIIFSHPFAVGDYLSVGGFEGTVKRIDMLNTTLFSFDNKEVIVPNSKMTTDVVVNFSAQKMRRLDLSYNVSYNSDLEKVKNILKSLIEENESVLADPAPLVAVGKYGDSAIEVVAKIWVPTEEYWNVYFKMQENVKSAFDSHGVEIPFPQICVHNS